MPDPPCESRGGSTEAPFEEEAVCPLCGGVNDPRTLHAPYCSRDHSFWAYLFRVAMGRRAQTVEEAQEVWDTWSPEPSRRSEPALVLPLQKESAHTKRRAER